MIYYSLAYTLIDIFGTYTVYRMFRIFFAGKEKNRLWEIESYIVCHVILAILYLVIRIPIIMSLTNLILFYGITLNYRVSVNERIKAIVLIYFILALIETMMALLNGMQIVVTEQTEIAKLTTIINIRAIGIIVVLLMERIKKKQISERENQVWWFILITVPLSLMYGFVLFRPNAINLQQQLFGIIILLFMYLTAFLYNAFLLEENQKRKMLEQENKYYLLQYKIVMNHSKEFSKIRHDMKNHVLVIKYLLENDKEELIHYVDEELQKGIKAREYIDSGNIAIDSVLNSKVFEAESYGIQIRVQIAIPEALTADSCALTVIVSGLLNHAIAETKGNLQENKVIDVILSYDRGLLFIQVIHVEEGKTDVIQKKYLPTRRGYHINSFNDEDIRKAAKVLSGNHRFKVIDNKVEAFVMLCIPLDEWI